MKALAAAIIAMLLLAPAAMAEEGGGKIRRMRCVTATGRVLRYYEVRVRTSEGIKTLRGWEFAGKRRLPESYLWYAERPRACVGDSWVVGERP